MLFRRSNSKAQESRTVCPDSKVLSALDLVVIVGCVGLAASAPIMAIPGPIMTREQASSSTRRLYP